MEVPSNVQRAMHTIAEYVGGESANPEPAHYAGIARIHHVEDGDTLYGSYRADPSIVVGKSPEMNAPEGVNEPGVWFRLIDVDTHETDSPRKEARQQAEEEKNFVEDFVNKGRQNSDHDWPFAIAYKGHDAEGTYGRHLTDIIRRSDGASLTEELLSNFDNIRYKGN